MANNIPMISSGTAGPLGVRHLPRLWLKVSLDGAGLLHSDYKTISGGFDQMVLAGLGIDKEKFQAYMTENKPTYCQLESWVLEQRGGSLDESAINKLNTAIVGYIHDDATRAEILEAAGRGDDGSVKGAVNLNNLDDWAAFHAENIA